jgi:hypothetical protein
MQLRAKLGKTFWPYGQLMNGICVVLVLMWFSPGRASAQQGWPRTIASDGETIQVYQPEVDKWGGGKLQAREAVVITTKGSALAIYGVVWFSARTSVNQDNREVTLYDITVTDASFPSASADETSYVESAKQALANWNFTIALDRLLADMAITQTEEKAPQDNFSTTPPKIYVRRNPALLILIDGDPVMKKINDTGLMRVINSPAVIVFDPATENYYLQGDTYWMTATNLNGPWSKSNNPPETLVKAVEEQEEPVPTGAAPTTTPATPTTEAPPEIIVSTEPAELIQLKGEEQFSPIAGTKLLYVTNTDGDLFMSVPDQRFYVLLSGRWFSAPKLDGPWQFVEGSKLPADFARIPPNHPKGEVLASVPGTPQARDAVVSAEVPQTATVDRKEATFTATYDGNPQFKAIEGTDMAYATNSPNYIIRVKEKYYAVSEGVWFVADDPSGPWEVCDDVPPEIYSIPPNVPVYPVKYVYVYDATPDYVYVGYLPGYFGAYIWDGVVVYGTGFWYPCWAFDYWYGWPWTWGFGWHYGYWGWGFHWRPWLPAPWYWRGWRRPGWGYGWWNQRVLYNRSIERRATQVNLINHTVYDRWKANAVVSRHPVPLRGPSPGVRPQVVPGRPAVGRPNIFAGRDGNVYQYRNGDWYRRNGQNWEKVPPARVQTPQGRPVAPGRPQIPPTVRPPQPTAPRPAAPRSAPGRPHASVQQLNQQRQARIQGQSRVTEFRSMQPAGARPAARPAGRPHR